MPQMGATIETTYDSDRQRRCDDYDPGVSDLAMQRDSHPPNTYVSRLPSHITLFCCQSLPAISWECGHTPHLTCLKV